MPSPLVYLRHTLTTLPSMYKLVMGHRQLIGELWRREINLRTNETAMGWLWLLLQPALQVLAFWFLFAFVLRVKFPGRLPYLDYLLAGIILWLLIAEVLLRSQSVLREYSALYQRSPFPLGLLPLMSLVVSGVIYGLVYGATMALLHGPVAGLAAVLLVPLVMLWLVPFCYLVSVMGLFLKDLGQVFPFVLTMGLYLTPILYVPQMLPENIGWLLAFNPFADIMAVAHALIQGEQATLGNYLRPVILWLVLLAPSWILFNRLIPHMREAL